MRNWYQEHQMIFQFIIEHYNLNNEIILNALHEFGWKDHYVPIEIYSNNSKIEEAFSKLSVSQALYVLTYLLKKNNSINSDTSDKFLETIIPYPYIFDQTTILHEADLIDEELKAISRSINNGIEKISEELHKVNLATFNSNALIVDSKIINFKTELRLLAAESFKGYQDQLIKLVRLQRDFKIFKHEFISKIISIEKSLLKEVKFVNSMLDSYNRWKADIYEFKQQKNPTIKKLYHLSKLYLKFLFSKIQKSDFPNGSGIYNISEFGDLASFSRMLLYNIDFSIIQVTQNLDRETRIIVYHNTDRYFDIRYPDQEDSIQKIESDVLFDKSLYIFVKNRNIIELMKEVQICFNVKAYNAAMLLLRKIMEMGIHNAMKVKFKSDLELRNSDNTVKPTKHRLNILVKKGILSKSLSKQLLTFVKVFGDNAAHNFKVKITKDDVISGSKVIDISFRMMFSQ